ncbi:MAG: secretin and TonB N-terminal domain-containing protein, partial [Methylococcales bacterium]
MFDYPVSGACLHRSRNFLSLLLSAFLLVSVMAEAQGAAQSYDIPAGPLASALNRLAETAGLQLVYDTDLTESLSSHGLNGNYTWEQALDRLLRGSGLSYRIAENGAVSIEKPPAKVNRTDEAALPKVKVVGTAGYDSTDPYNPDYNRPNATTATKTDTPIIDTPVSI